MTSDSSLRDAQLTRLADEFAERYRRGERPSLHEYVARHPELADDIRHLFPTLVKIEQVKEDRRADAVPTPVPSPPMPALLGDFRILREIGHGGMGVVYEAEQLSLGRRVALKVLPQQSLRDARQRRRFEREAKSAAKLHHTNIVPVFGVGEHEGVAYFVMQFIHGLGLDAVIDELDRMQNPGKETESAVRPANPGQSGIVRELAFSLVTGDFGPRVLDAVAEQEEVAEQATLCELAGGPVGAALPPVYNGSTSEMLSTSSVQLPGQSGDQQPGKGRKLTYWQSVANIGAQVAGALDYAHKQGIIHRDIKPSNLLLDQRGTVWITDFGLAKSDDKQNLTHTGDILGTLRYMAPEAFDGRTDHRSDVYALGLTLYELLVLRPAFAEENRPQLIKQVTTAEPPRLNRLNRAIPRDLVTIVHKAIDRDPAHRYQTAAELAADLQRFLDDEPIKARRLLVREQAWRWSRRNKAVAASLAAAVVLLLGLVVVSLGAAAYFRQQEDEQRRLAGKNKVLAEAVEEKRLEAVANSKSADKARDEAVAESYKALFSETLALRLSRSSGWRARALANLRRLSALDTPQRDMVALRSEALACLPEFDAEEEQRIEVPGKTGVKALNFSPDGRNLASMSGDGSIRLWDPATGRQMRQLQAPGSVPGHPLEYGTITSAQPALCFHPLLPRLAYTTWTQEIRWLELMPNGRAIPSLVVAGEKKGLPPILPRGLTLDGKGRHAAASWANGRVEVYDSSTGTRLSSFDSKVGDFGLLPVALDGTGEVLALAGAAGTVQTAPAAGGSRRTLGSHRGVVSALCFSPSGESLASASFDHTVKLWNLRGSGDPLTLLGHTANVWCVAYSPDGSLVASGSSDETVRIWDARTGLLLVILQPRLGPVLSVAFSSDGARLAVGANTICLYRLIGSRERRRLVGHSHQVNTLAFHPLKEVLASGASDRGVILWDVASARLLRRWMGKRNLPIHRTAFSPDGSLLAVGVCNFNNFQGTDFSVELRDTENGSVRRLLDGPRTNVLALRFDARGHLGAAAGDGSVWIWDVGTGEVRHCWKSKDGAACTLDFLNNGAQTVVAELNGRVVVRDLASGQIIQETVFPGGLECAAVTADEHFSMIGCTDGSVRVLSLPDLQVMDTIPQAHTGRVVCVACSPDGRLLATGGSDRRVVVYDLATRRPLFVLPQISHVNTLQFDRTSTILALGGIEHQVTLWELGELRPGLADLGLDWASSMATGPEESKPLPANLEGTVRLLRALLERHPDLAAPSNSLSWIYSTGPEKWRDPGLALVLAKRAAARAPDNAVYQTTLGLAYYRNGQFGLAASALRDIQAEQKNARPLGTLILAMSEFHLGNAAKARSLFDQARPWWQEGLLDSQEVHDLEHLRAEAAQLLARAQLPEPATAEDRLTRARAYIQIGQFEAAAADLERTTELRPGDANLRLECARLYVRLARWAEAGAQYDRALALAPKTVGVGSPRALICLEVAGLPRVFAWVVERRPQDYQLWIAHGRLSACSSNWKEAIADYARVIESRPVDDESVEYAALLLLADDVGSYRRYCARLVEKTGEPKNNFAAFALARCCALAPQGVDRPARLVGWAESAVRQASKAWYLHALGLAHYRVGQYELAVRRLRESDFLGWDSNVQNWLVLAMAYHHLGQTEDARQWLDEAVQWIDRANPATHGDRAPLQATDWLECQVLRREAEALIWGK